MKLLDLYWSCEALSRLLVFRRLSFKNRMRGILEYDDTFAIQFYGRSNLSHHVWQSCARWCNVFRDLMDEHRAGVQLATRAPCHCVLSYLPLQHPSRMDLYAFDNAGECTIHQGRIYIYISCTSCSNYKKLLRFSRTCSHFRDIFGNFSEIWNFFSRYIYIRYLLSRYSRYNYYCIIETLEKFQAVLIISILLLHLSRNN